MSSGQRARSRDRAATSRVDLSSQDLDILHEIVEYATVIPETTPWNALFKSYDAVLKARRIDPRQDDRCFRFLMHMAEVNEGTWLEKFETLLERWGYIVPTHLPGDSTADDSLYSEHEAFFHSDESQNSDYDGPVDDQSSTPENSEDDSPRKADSVRFRDLDGSSLMLKKQQREIELQSREEEQKRQDKLRAKREFAFPTDIIENADFASNNNRRDNIDSTYEAKPMDVSSAGIDVDNVEIAAIREPQDHLRAVANAAELYNIRAQHSVINILNIWRANTAKIVKYHEIQHQLAIAQDRRVLLAQTIEVWREKTYWTMVEAKVEEESVAKCAVKVLQQWREKTKIIVDRRKRVNDFILMRKWFAAWRWQTHETAQKVRYMALRSASRLLCQGIARHHKVQERAIVKYHHDLTYRAYWTWYFHFCGSRAQSWHNSKLKLGVLTSMKDKLDEYLKGEAQALQIYRVSCMENSLAGLVDSLAKVRKQNQVSEVYNRQRLLKRYLAHWTKATVLQPHADTVQDIVNDRILYNALSLWKTRTRQNKAATQVCRIRLLRSTFRCLDLEFRKRIFEATLMEKRKSQAMYLMVIQVRHDLLKRKRDTELLGRAMHTLRHFFQTRMSVMQVAERSAKVHAAQHRQRLVMSWWVDKLRTQQHKVDMADVFYRQILLRRYTKSLQQKFEHIHETQTWAQSANYFLTSKTYIRLWQEAVKASQRSKRRIAFNTVVQKRRQELKRSTLLAMFRRYQTIKNKDKIAQQMQRRVVDNKAQAYIYSWRLQLQQITVSDSLADSFYACQLLDFSLNKMKSRLSYIDKLEEIKQEYVCNVERERLTNIIRRWSMQLFSIKMDGNKADSLHDRMEQNRKRSLLRVWKQLSLAKRNAKAIQEQLLRQQLLMEENPSETGEISTLEDTFSITSTNQWTDLPRASSKTSESPIQPPVFPKTPGGRAARARALMQTENVKPRPSRFDQMLSMNNTGSTTPVGSPFLSRQSSFAKSKAFGFTQSKLFSKSMIAAPERREAASYLPVLKDFNRMSLSSSVQADRWAAPQIRIHQPGGIASSYEANDLGGSTTVAFKSDSKSDI